MDSVRAWAVADPAHPMVAERGAGGKGYVNQRQVLANRTALVELFYTEPVPAGVIVAEGT